MTSRGCPFRCSYCFNHSIVKVYEEQTGMRGAESGYIRSHPVEDVIDEIRFLTTSYNNVQTLIFDDDLFTFDKGYLLEFCRAYGERFSIPFVCNAHVRVFDDEMARALKAAGCRMVKFGLESGGPRVRRDVLNRRMTNQQIAAAFSRAHAAGLETSAFVMIGLRRETRDDIEMTLQLLADIRPTGFRWSIFFPYPGTRAYELARADGLINHEKMAKLSNTRSCVLTMSSS